MLRSFVSVVAIYFLLFAFFFLPESVSARSKRCPVKMPETLLSLYRNSDAIHIARYDKKEDGEVSEETADYTALSIKKYFSISSTLKGESRKFFALEENEYRYKNTSEAESSQSDEIEQTVEFDIDDGRAALKAGDDVLLFLKNDDEGATRLTDYSDGVKKLSVEQIGVYETRIKELSSIFASDEVNQLKIVEWLVRCAEDPATRWEGAFELLQSFQNLEWEKQRAEQRLEKIARGENIENDEYEVLEREDMSTGNTIFAKLLDETHKQALSNILLNRELHAASDDQTKSTFIRGDRELIELVKRWGDSRLANYLLDQLRNGSENAYQNAQLMGTIAEMLNDSQVSALSEKYNGISYEKDSDEVEVSNEAEEVDQAAIDDAAIAVQPIEGENIVIAVPDVGEEETAAVAEAEKPKKLTYKDLRQEILGKFIERSEKVLAKMSVKLQFDNADAPN